MTETGRHQGVSYTRRRRRTPRRGDPIAPEGRAVALTAQTLKRRFTETGRHKGVPYTGPNSAEVGVAGPDALPGAFGDHEADDYRLESE